MKLNEKKLSLRFRAKTFYFASFFLPKKLKQEIEILYIFCRFIDDLGDSNNSSKTYILKYLKRIKSEIKTKSSPDSKIDDFIKMMEKYKIEENIPFQLINGVEGDLRNVNFVNLKQLIQYSFKVAGTVGYMFCKIIGVKDKNQIFRGVQLGIAMQLTNIARDVEEDLVRKRIYIPKSMRSYKKPDYEFILKSKNIKKMFSMDLKSFLDKGDDIYQNSWEGIYKLPLRYRLPIGIAAELYQQIGNKIKKKNYNVWNQRVYLSKVEKFFFALKVFRRIIFVKKVNVNYDVDNKIKNALKPLDFISYE